MEKSKIATKTAVICLVASHPGEGNDGARDYLVAIADAKVSAVASKCEGHIAKNPRMPEDRKEALRANAVSQRAGFADVLKAVCAAAAADAAPGLPPWLRESAATRSNMLSVVIKDRQQERELSGARMRAGDDCEAKMLEWGRHHYGPGRAIHHSASVVYLGGGT